MSSIIENIPFIGNLYKSIEVAQSEFIQGAMFLAIGVLAGAVVYVVINKPKIKI